MSPMAVAQSSSSRVTKSQGEGVVLRVFLPTDNALYSIAFGTHTKTAEPIEVPFGMMTRVGCRYHVLDGGPDPPRARGNFGEREKHNNVAAMFAAKGIIQYARQAKIGIWKILSASDAAYRPGRG